MGITRRTVIGSALAGLGDSLGSYFAKSAEDTMLRRRQAENQNAITAREQDNKRADLVRSFADKVAQHPDQYDTLAQGAAVDPLLRGIDLSGLKPTPAALLKPIGDLLNTAKSPTDIPADIGAAMTSAGVPTPSVPLSNAAQFGAQADYADATPDQNRLLNLASSRLNQLGDQRAANTAAEVDTTGRKAFATNYNEGLGKSSAATDTLDQDMANQVSKLVNVGPTEAKNAGMKAAAEARARAAVEFDPINIANAATLAGEKAKAEAVSRGDTSRLKYIETAKENGVTLGAQLQRLTNLYDQAKRGNLQAASLYNDLSNNLRPVIARASGYNGRMTNAELGIAGGAIPGIKDALLGTADQKFRYIKGLATYGPTVAGSLPPDASIDEYMSAVQRLVDQEPPPSGKSNIKSVTPIPR